jgi:hypothetical protein
MRPVTSLCLLSLCLVPVRAGDEPPGRGDARKNLKAVADFLGGEIKDIAYPPLPRKEFDALLAFVKKLKDDDDIRKDTIALARKHAMASEYRDPRGEGRGALISHQNRDRAYAAWKILWETGVLKNGMTLDDATAVLGKPTQARGDFVSWHVPSQLRSLTLLSARVKDGRLEAINGIR